MPPRLEDISPKFRQLTDLLLFSDRVDLDLSNFKQLLRENHSIHLRYLLDRLDRSFGIAWENGEKFWEHRFAFLFSLNERALTNTIEKYLDDRFVWMLKSKPKAHPYYDLEYLQYLQYCKVKKQRKENLLLVKRNLLEAANYCTTDKLLDIILTFIPDVFRDINEYVKAVSQRITHSTRNIDILRALERRGVEFEKDPLVRLAKEILLIRSYSERNCRAFFALLHYPGVLDEVKATYSPTYREAILEILRECDHYRIDEFHLRNVGNLLELDPSLASDILIAYADKLYGHYLGHKKSDIDKLIRLLKKFPQCSPKELLAHLSGAGHVSDLKKLVKAFPELDTLIAFV